MGESGGEGEAGGGGIERDKEKEGGRGREEFNGYVAVTCKTRARGVTVLVLNS